jgi:DNA-binding response OmpR family regulator
MSTWPLAACVAQSYREVTSAEIPIVGASAAMTAERLRDLGVRVCLAKPFDLGELLECLHGLVDQQAGAATGADLGESP